jgi:hypothetical protein
LALDIKECIHPTTLYVRGGRIIKNEIRFARRLSKRNENTRRDWLYGNARSHDDEYVLR